MMNQHLDQAIRTSFSNGLKFDRAAAFDPMILLMRVVHNVADLLLAFAPLALILIVVSIAAPVLVGGWVFSNKVFVPQFSRMNPIKGIGNMFSKNSLVELIKSVGKATLVGIVAYIVIAGDMDPIMSMSTMPLEDGISQVNHLMLYGFITISSTLVIIAMIDVPFQLYRYAEKLKMTKEEVKKESKESEGNPEIKAKIRQQQREMARRRMMSQIPQADVVITNPTHYAVAIAYQDQGMRAPTVVAKGADAVALKIREIASEHNIVTLESPKLARALFAHTELDEEIPEALYAAVAEILAYVFQLRIYKSQGGYNPELPTALAVPDELDPHSLLPAPSLVDTEVLA
jgi:flagellar biosynthesis protein FlhB